MIEIIDKFEGKHAFLSNFSPHGFKLKDIWFPTNEHFYQAMKCKVGDVENFRLIAKAKTPGIAKKMGSKKGYRDFKIELRHDWEDIKFKVMSDGLRFKFRQNPELIQELLDTGDAILIEGNHWHDNIWGNCKCEKCILTMGKNMLGIILMFIRSEFRKDK